MSTTVDLKTKEEKDAELDRRIEALRKKNEALVRRYQEIEEDKKKAEQEGIAVTTARKPRLHEAETDRRRTEKENFTVTVDLSKPAGEKRVINDRKPGTHRGGFGLEEEEPQGGSPPRRPGSGRLNRGAPRGGSRQDRREPRPDRPEPRHDRAEPRHDRAEPRPDRPLWDSEVGEGPGRTERTPRGRRGRGGGGGSGGGGGGGGGTPQGGDRKSKEWEEKRRQNIEKMNEEMEKIAEYERGQRGDGDKNPIRNFLDDPRRCGPIPDLDRKEGSRRHVRNWGGLDFDNVKTGAELEKEWMSRRPGPKGSMDMIMTGRERAEYLRWKKEREQIDEERLARHRNATGQWRREWDAQKTDTMFKEEAAAATEGTLDQGSRRARGHNANMQRSSLASDDSKRPPKATTFGEFLGQGKPKDGGRGGRGRGRGRAQNKSYSMHDNRWEAEEDEREKESEESKGDMKQPPSSKDKVQVEEQKVSGGVEEEDEDEWEDASDGEEEEEEGEEEEEMEGEEVEKEAVLSEKPKGKTSSLAPATAASPSSPQGVTDSPREQHTPRPRVHIPSPQSAQDSPESAKPLSPFSPLEGYQPVSDWGEEMEMQFPRSTLGESPLKPRTEESPSAQKPGSPIPAEPQVESQGPSQPAEQIIQTSEQTVTVSQPQQEPDVLEPHPDDALVVMEHTDLPSHTPEVGKDPTPQDVPASSDTYVPAPLDSDQNHPTVGTVTVTEAPEQPSSGVVHITGYETVAFRKKLLTPAER